MTNPDKKKTCFVISPIGLPGSPARKTADLVLKHILKAALEPLGYTVVRADEISQPGSITLQVLERVLQSDLVAADLTDNNPNVFYELAVRHASEKPVIHVIQSGQKIPFDIADLRAIFIDTDLEGAERSRNDVTAQVRQIEAGHVGETPVKLAGVLKHFETGKSEEKIILRQVLDGMSELRSDFRVMLETVLQSFHEMKVTFNHMIAVSEHGNLGGEKPFSKQDLQAMFIAELARKGMKADVQWLHQAIKELLTERGEPEIPDRDIMQPIVALMVDKYVKSQKEKK